LVEGGEDKKIIEITVTSAKNLSIAGSGNTFNAKRMLPFFNYDFYTFEFRSHTA
jgi:hypothetical protein